MPDRDDELSSALRDYYQRMAQAPAPDLTGRIMMSADRRAARMRRWGAVGGGVLAAAAVGAVVAIALVNHNQPTSVAPGHSTPSPSASASATPSPTPAITPSPVPVLAEPTGGPVPPGFTAWSVTFVSPSEGWVLGTAPCSTPPCTSVLRTQDGAATWQAVPAPRIQAPGGATGGIIRFADRADGWVAVGGQFQATHDGGATWNAVSIPGMPSASVSDVETNGEVAYAWVEQTNTDAVAGGLYKAGVGSDSWSVVSSVPGGQGSEGRISLVGARGWVAVGLANVYATTDGDTWHALPSPCPSGNQVALAAANATTVYASCTAGGSAGGSMVTRTVVVSHDGGQSFHPVSRPPQTGDLDGIAATPDGQTVGLSVSTAGPGSIQLSGDGGSGWSTAYSADQTGGAGFADLGFTTDTQGVVVLAPGQSGVLLMTRDGGTSWVAVRF